MNRTLIGLTLVTGLLSGVSFAATPATAQDSKSPAQAQSQAKAAPQQVASKDKATHHARKHHAKAKTSTK